MKNLKQLILSFKWYELVSIIIFYTAIITLSIIAKSGYVSIISAITGLLAATINVKASKICFIFYVISAVFYAYIVFTKKLYGEFLFQTLYIVPLYVISIIMWIVNKKNITSLTINSITKKQLIILPIIVVLVTICYGTLLKYVFKDINLPYLNALSTAICGVCGYLTSKRIIQQWLVWVLYSIIVALMMIATTSKIDTSGIPILVLNCCYVIINIYGYFNWYHLRKLQQEAIDER